MKNCLEKAPVQSEKELLCTKIGTQDNWTAEIFKWGGQGGRGLGWVRGAGGPGEGQGGRRGAREGLWRPGGPGGPGGWGGWGAKGLGGPVTSYSPKQARKKLEKILVNISTFLLTSEANY